MKYIILILSTALWVSCGGSAGGSSSGVAANLGGFDTYKISGSNSSLNIKKASNGKVTEEGITEGGAKHGMWTTYHDEGQVKSVTSYVNGKKNGLSIEFSTRGQVESKTGYLNDQYHGIVGSYKFGKVLKEVTYNNGKVDGPFVEYNDKGKMQKRGSFKNGQQDGKLEFFDDEENLVMEYIYKDGEKISGGIVSKKEEDKPIVE